MKIQVCDICRKEGKLIEAARYVKLQRSTCRIDVCATHSAFVKTLKNVEFVKLSYELSGVELSDDEAKKILLGRC